MSKEGKLVVGIDFNSKNWSITTGVECDGEIHIFDEMLEPEIMEYLNITLEDMKQLKEKLKEEEQ